MVRRRKRETGISWAKDDDTGEDDDGNIHANTLRLCDRQLRRIAGQNAAQPPNNEAEWLLKLAMLYIRSDHTITRTEVKEDLLAKYDEFTRQ